MSHLPNWQEYGTEATQEKQQDATCVHDKIYGTYKDNQTMKPTVVEKPSVSEYKPFAVK